MNDIILSGDFVKHFKKRIKPKLSLMKSYEERVDLFLKNRNESVLKDHKLIGKMSDFRAFSITGDIRVVYRIVNNYYRFEDIGTHNQVYK